MEVTGDNPTIGSSLEISKLSSVNKRYAFIESGNKSFVMDRLKKTNDNIKEIDEFAKQLILQDDNTIEELCILKDFFAKKINEDKIELFFKTIHVDNQEDINLMIEDYHDKFEKNAIYLEEIYEAYKRVYDLDPSLNHQAIVDLIANINTQELPQMALLLKKMDDYPKKYESLKPLFNKLLTSEPIDHKKFKKELELIDQILARQRTNVQFKKGPVVPILQYFIHEQPKEVQEKVKRIEEHPHVEIKKRELSPKVSLAKVKSFKRKSLTQLINNKEFTESMIFEAFKVDYSEAFSKKVKREISKRDIDMSKWMFYIFDEVLYEVSGRVEGGDFSPERAVTAFNRYLQDKISEKNKIIVDVNRETFKILAGNLVNDGSGRPKLLKENAEVKNLVKKYNSNQWTNETYTVDYPKFSSSRINIINKILNELFKRNSPLLYVLNAFFKQIAPKKTT